MILLVMTPPSSAFCAVYCYRSNHTPGTLRAIPSGFLNLLDKLTSRKPSIHSERVDKIYPNHINALRKAGLTPHNFLTMGDLWSKQDEKVEI